MSQLYKDLSGSEKEGRIKEAAAAYLDGEFPSIRQAAVYHGVPSSTLIHRLKGRTTR